MQFSRTRESAQARRFSLCFAGLLITAAVIAFNACNGRRESASSVAVNFKITPEPARVGPVSIQLSLDDGSSHPVNGARITLEADMSHPGMAPIFSEAKETGSGSYQGMLEISMPGDWVVLVHGQLADGRRLERQMDMKGVTAK